ncbi:unnamed protein product [Discula destructiva]
MPSGSESAKQKFEEAVDKTHNSVGDAKGPPIKVAQPSTNDASISNKFVNPGRTAHPHPDTVEAEQKTASNSTSFFKGSVS